MASVIQMPTGKWRALCRRKGFKTKCRTFKVKSQAETWARGIEAEWDKGGEPAPTVGDLTIGDVIDAYEAMREKARPISDSSNEHYMIKALRRGLAHLRLRAATPDDLVSYAVMRKEEGAGPYTINMDISKLGTILRYGGAYLRVSPPDIVGAARPLLAHLRMIGGGGKRERRPTEDEMARIVPYMAETYGRQYADAVVFAAITAMRRGEVCAIKKVEIDQRNRIVPVWRKHPRKGKTLERVPLLFDSMELALRQPDSEDGRVFPFDPGTLSKYFIWSCRALSIIDLQLRDMRHEGASRMFEAGMQIPQVAMVTGHKKWETLKIYTQLKPEDVKSPSPASDPDDRPRRGSRRTASPGQDRS